MQCCSILKILASFIVPFMLTASIATEQAPSTPILDVPACPKKAHLKFDRSVPDLTPFPLTTVDLCYGVSTLEFDFTAYHEKYFFYNSTQGTNDNLFEYEVMEAFLHFGNEDPQTYVEIEINPANVTYQAFIYNPSKRAAAGAPFGNIVIPRPADLGFRATTSLDKPAKKWTSQFIVPLGLFNIDDNAAKFTLWRMNFFRTITNSTLYPKQILGAWSPPNQPKFHITSYFGYVTFI